MDRAKAQHQIAAETGGEGGRRHPEHRPDHVEGRLIDRLLRLQRNLLDLGGSGGNSRRRRYARPRLWLRWGSGF